MQILKEEIREKILQKAAEEFLAHGYERASMRSIAREATISVGNLYNYYKSKEDLYYSITNASYGHLTGLLNKVQEHGREGGFENREFVSLLIQNISELLKAHRTGFLLMIDKGLGTKYANLREELIAILARHFESELSDTSPLRDSVIMRIAAKNVIDGLIEIARNYRNDGWVDSNIDELMDYHLHGISRYYA